MAEISDATKPAAAKSPSTNDAYVRIQGLTKRFGESLAVDSVDLAIKKGEIFGLMGSSGSGKSTLLHMLAGLETPTEGRIYIDGEDMSNVSPYLRPINLMFQSYALFPHMTVWQNVAFGLKQDKLATQEVNERTEEMLAMVHMMDYAKRKPEQLSGGQRQRVALARSLAKRPKLLLLDEPMGALDKKLRERMQLEVVNILEKVGVTCLMVTHDQEEAMTMSTRIGIMHKGRVMQIGAPNEVYETPNSRFTAEFIGSINIFEGVVTEDSSDHAVITSPEMGEPIYIGHGISANLDMQVWVGVRPEKISLSLSKPEGKYNFAEGTVHDIAYMGSHSIYYVRLKSGKMTIANIYNSDRFISEPITWNDKVYLSFNSESAVVLVI